MNFIKEFKRRKMAQVAITYAVTGWLLLQVIAVVLPTFDAPRWVSQTLMLLVFLGFPVTLVFSWMFNITGTGIVRDRGAEASAPSSHAEKAIRIEQVMISLLVVAVAILFIKIFSTGDATNPSGQLAGLDTDNSIAVLPFTNISNDPEQEYFSDGLTEELINRLSAVDGLLVTGRTSAFYFKGSEENPREIAESLGVNHILQGTVRKSGDQLRISATLMDASTGFNLWTNTFDRQLADIFEIQDEISSAVTTALSITLGAGEFNRPGMTRNVDAYDAWLQSTQIGFISTPDVVRAKIEAAERAVSIDPEFALGWLALNDAYFNGLVFLDGDERTTASQRMLEALQQATSLNPDMRELVTARNLGDYDLLEYEQLLQQELDQFGNVEATPNLNYSAFLLRVGRIEDALLYARRGYRFDPYNPMSSGLVGASLLMLGRLGESREFGERVLMLTDYQQGQGGFHQMAMLELMEGNIDAAIAWSENLVLTRDGQLRLLRYMEAGDINGALEEIQRIVNAPASAETNVLRGRHLPAFAALLGEPELAVEIIAGLPELGSKRAAIDLLWQPLGQEARSTEAFKTLVTDIGLVDYWRASGSWSDFCRPLEGSDDFECF